MNKKIISKSVLSIITLITFFCILSLNIYGANVYQDFRITDEELYNQTNTYNLKENLASNLNSLDINDARYDFFTSLSETSLARNGKTVSTGSPNITVLTHGLGGNASHFSNNGASTFYHSEGSLIDELYKKYGGYVYYAEVTNGQSLEIKDITSNVISKGKYDGITIKTSSYSYNINSDISKHIIVIYNATNSNVSNARDYTNFNFMLSKIVYDFKYFNGGVLPRINLIGHSRGGLTNLQYAMDHPDLVDKIFSMGTPYNSSTISYLDKLFGYPIGGGTDGQRDVMNYSLQNKYKERWNKYYKTLGYENIATYALVGNTAMEMLSTLILSSDFQNFLPNWNFLRSLITNRLLQYISSLSLVADGVMVNINTLANINLGFLNYLGSLKWLGGVKDVANTIEDFFRSILNDFAIDIYTGKSYLTTDLFVESQSQSALGYKGFISKIKTFSLQNSKFDKLSIPGDVPIVHNLEARDPDFIKYIMAEIVKEGSGPGHFNLNNTEGNDYSYIYLEPKDYGFKEQYYFYDQLTTINKDNISFDTKRLRAGYIQNEYVVMSPRRVGAGTAYLEYKFDELIHRIDVDLSLWSSSELLKPSDCTAVFQYKNKNGEWVTKTDLLNDITLSTDRSKPNCYTFIFEEPITEFRFLSTAPEVGSSNNTGRVCIGNMTVVYKEIQELESHTHSFEYRYYDRKSHILKCICGQTSGSTRVHMITFEQAMEGFAICLECLEVLDLNFDMAIVGFSSPLYITPGGSYISVNGIIVLSAVDYEAYKKNELDFSALYQN